MKNILKTTIAVCVAAVGVGLAATSGNTYADTSGLTYITVTNLDGTNRCDIYDGSGSFTYWHCDSTYGTYDATTSTLTLGPRVNDMAVSILDQSNPGNSYTISATSNLTLRLVAPSYSNITYDLGSYSITQSDDSAVFFPSFGSVVMKSGTLNFSSSQVTPSLTINGGTINMEYDGAGLGGRLGAKNVFTMNAGTINLTNSYIDITNEANINGGSINIEYTGANATTEGINLAGASSGTTEFNLNGGTVAIKGAEYGIWAHETATAINIAGGALNIDANRGIMSSNGGTIEFDGGVTTIKNSKEYAVDLRKSSDPENDIVFGEGMGIMEPGLYVFWTDENYDNGSAGNWTGIVAANTTVTIAEGGTVKRNYGWEIGGDTDPVIDDGESDEADVKVPDTGVFGGENSGVIAVVASVGALVMLAGGTYVIGYVIRRHSAGVGFQKKQY